MNGKPSNIGVVHLVYRPFGLAPFRSFINSYQAFHSGVPHDLILLLKGFSVPSEFEPFSQLIRQMPHLTLTVPDGGFDIGSYRRAVRAFPRPFYVFVNSRTVFIQANWLRTLWRHATLPSVGAVGATGSFESLYDSYLRRDRRDERHLNFIKRRVRASFMNRIRHRIYFPRFPNAHIRTNAFMVKRSTFEKIRFRNPQSRLDTACFENGRFGFTRQLEALGLHALVVGADGSAYKAEHWPRSGTFWQARQENLLVSDNQTEAYRQASQEQQRAMAERAWGYGQFAAERNEVIAR